MAKRPKVWRLDGPFDILIVDLGLPDQDGIDLILKLRQLGVTRAGADSFGAAQRR